MSRENEEQRPVSQTFCGALQKEPNCKCLVLSVLIYGCLAAVTWCRCANVTKIVINFSKNPIKSTKHVSPCDDGYIYIPVAFMGMLYLVYLVECYHSPIRLDLLHAESQDSVLARIMQLRLAQPTIWWKAVSYHYVRRKRQITRYRNGDNYTTTQVYYERVNTHAATSFYYYDYCGVKDISKNLTVDTKTPITKIALTKGFAFSNIRSATEFEEARSRFFAEQELRDDYMEMREGLDLGHNPNPSTLVAVLGKPWFTNPYVYWCLSAILLSWPLRVIIEYNTQYADYQVTKLFGINYDTPTSGEPIHASTSQLSQPGSYMLAPSYSEALLMEPAVSSERNALASAVEADADAQMVPSYSEALLYDRAEQGAACASRASDGLHQEALPLATEVESGCRFVHDTSGEHARSRSMSCVCPCHIKDGVDHRDDLPALEGEVDRAFASSGPEVACDALDATFGPLRRVLVDSSGEVVGDLASSPGEAIGDLVNSSGEHSRDLASSSNEVHRDLAAASADSSGEVVRHLASCSLAEVGSSLATSSRSEREVGSRSFAPPFGATSKPSTSRRPAHGIPRDVSEPNLRSSSHDTFSSWQFLRQNGRSLENILEREEESPAPEARARERASGVIPRRSGSEPEERVPAGNASGISGSSTYFCLRSILKRNGRVDRRRYTLLTASELRDLIDENERRLGKLQASSDDVFSGSRSSRRIHFHRSFAFRDARRKRENDTGSRSLIFASPIQEVCPNDPFGGKRLVTPADRSNRDETFDLSVLTRLGRSFVERDRKRCGSFDEDLETARAARRPASLVAMAANGSGSDVVYICRSPDDVPSLDAVEDVATSGNARRGLTRSFTERRPKPGRRGPVLPRSFAGRADFDVLSHGNPGGRRTNLNMETSL